MATWDSYTQKSTPADADTLMIKDTSGGANKRTPFSGVWNWILTKLTNAVISQLETTNKSIIPAINELNSKSWEISYNELKENDNLNNKSKSGFYRITDDLKAKTIINNPVTGIASCSFTMMVLCIQPEHYSTQILVPYANDIDKIYVRKMVNDKWGTWKSFSFS